MGELYRLAGPFVNDSASVAVAAVRSPSRCESGRRLARSHRGIADAASLEQSHELPLGDGDRVVRASCRERKLVGFPVVVIDESLDNDGIAFGRRGIGSSRRGPRAESAQGDTKEVQARNSRFVCAFTVFSLFVARTLPIRPSACPAGRYRQNAGRYRR
jgi:hypothetical protein